MCLWPLWQLIDDAGNLCFCKSPEASATEIAQARCCKSYHRCSFVIRNLKNSNCIILAHRQVILNQFATIGFKSLTAGRDSGWEVFYYFNTLFSEA